jgi:EAL domain-containing protein (putative c-di-GMP-specific phosphodiesterase class I)
VDIIKVDQSFVRDMNRDPGDEAIVRAVINLGRSLGIKVVAEGIETEAQAAQLIALQCDFGQGFLFSRAVPARRVPALAARWGARPGRAAEPGLRLVASRG